MNSNFRISLERGESETFATEGVDRLLSCNLASLTRLWINSLRVQMSRESPVPGLLFDCVGVGMLLKAAIWAWSWLMSYLNASYSWMAFS